MRIVLVLLAFAYGCGPGASVKAGGVAMSGSAFVPAGTSGGQSVGIRYKEHSGFMARLLAYTLEGISINQMVNPGRKATSSTSVDSHLETQCAGGQCTTSRVTTTTTVVTDSRNAEEIASDNAKIAELSNKAVQQINSHPVGIETTLDIFSTKLGGDTSGISYYAMGTGAPRWGTGRFSLRTSVGLGISKMSFKKRKQYQVVGSVGLETAGGLSPREKDETVWMLGIPVRLNWDLGRFFTFYSQVDLNMLTAFAMLTAEEDEAVPPTTVRFGMQAELGPVVMGIGTLSNSLDSGSTSVQGELLIGF